ncbi:uncharacterized protein TRAVEDRAFT_54903 [Trametes versicolor FP-101664 SS1]|uniref:uncharacterized protein n=1 Tax=Trametes versicolor (strain FP-101664) TaxID=717944 RepID=UPI00046224C8|nr:uncharacterized protein TRAVEDRAFT_54903 [Trametes versicolor FP-101664 SS1]EIW63704.1 hypothetical protein TRAVEDRAFT_54903 [Trametes versicolor FP-101664 SS1]
MSGRGAYYKQLYGGGRGRGRGGGGGGGPSSLPDDSSAHNSRGTKRPHPGDNQQGSRSSEDLLRIARSLGGKNYPAYRDLQGAWDYPTFRLYVDHVQSDPYAPPSKLRVRIPHSVARIPQTLWSNKIRTVALRDYLTRRVGRREQQQGGWASEKGGEVKVDRPGQQVLERTSVVLTSEDSEHGAGVELRCCVGLPAQGRTILGDQALRVFSSVIPALAQNLLYASHDAKHISDFIDCIEDQEDLRAQITAAGLVAFVPNGAILPRTSGASDMPMASPNVVAFQSPTHLERTFVLPHRGQITGIGIPKGVTMIAGGGFHGKSTLLDALARGCYNHVPGDGREFLVTSAHCVSIQGEDGRAVTNVNISPFITNLPGGTSTTSFSTQDASGSTSMAAGVIEAIELGADTLLFDEDSCATNFLIRDRRMQHLIAADPITPLVYKVRAMLADHNCSSILVIGGCGDYCDVADLVLEMRDYRCYDITAAAKQIAQEIPSAVPEHEATHFGTVRPRNLQTKSLPSRDTKTTVRKRTAIEVGGETLDLSALAQLVHDSQTRAIAAALKHIHHTPTPRAHLHEVLQDLDASLDSAGLDTLSQEDRIDGFLARPRPLELGMAINRLVRGDIQYTLR